MFSSFQKIILNRNQLALSGMQSSGSGVWREQAWGNNSETCFTNLPKMLPHPACFLSREDSCPPAPEKAFCAGTVAAFTFTIVRVGF